MANGCYVNQEGDSHGHSVAGKKYVIYTVITGDFDAIKAKVAEAAQIVKDVRG